ncbi:unnamed protein product [Moneuplotes crassus]|uniref:Uncharacterized protein n=1 Tax=Euplotes crassus TaxID=5936 RepID=A0AAD1U8F2_EUPCR|nr:unnamed protein product [Moneuplotes crassus]
MSITKEIALNGLVKKNVLSVPMHQISELNILQEFSEIKLDKLESLNASSNMIECIEEFVKKCLKLELLDYSLNKITKIENLNPPDQTSKLKFLNLSQNQISSITGLNKLSNLVVLDLSMNFIEKIENLEGLDSLEQLILFGNRIRVLENLDGLGNLKVLKINNNRLLTISELALYDFHSLQVLHAADNIIDTDELESCIKTVLSLEALQELSLYGNLVADDPTYKFAFSDHTNLAKLDGLELKPAIKQKFQSMKKDYEIDKLVETTKEEYFKRIEAERELKVAAANMLKKQQKSITDQYDNFIEYMERDFDGFINYVYDLKKRKDLGQENEITDIDLYQWRKTLQEKEEERLRLLEEALNGIESKEKFMLGSQILSSDKEEAYKASMPFPNMASQLDKKGVYMEIDPEKRQMYPPPSNKSRIDDALDGYEKFKDEDYKAKEKHQQIMNDPSIGDLNYQPPPPDIPNLRDPRLRELYQEEDKNNLEPDNDFKNLGETEALDQNKYY